MNSAMGSAPAGIWSTIASTVRAELDIRLHSQSLLVQLLFLLAVCAALAPQPDASYAIIKIGNAVPIMSADTALVAAAAVINLLMILGFALMLDVGRVRDSKLGIKGLFRTQPVAVSLLAVGRLLANLLYGFGFAASVAVALMTTLSVRYGVVPDLTALSVFLLLVAPAVTVAAMVGALIDLALPDSPAIKTMTAVVVWIVIVMAGISGSVDLVGTGGLRELLGAGRANAGLSLGLVPTDGAPTVVWKRLENVDSMFIEARIFIGCAVFGIAFAVAAVAAPLLNMEYHRSLRRVGIPIGAGPIVAIPATASQMSRSHPRPKSVLKGLFLTSIRLYRRSPFAMVLLSASIVIGFSVNLAPGIAISIILAVPFLLLARTGPAEITVARTIEKCEPALQFPNAALLNCLSMLAWMLLAGFPAFVRIPLAQALTAACGMAVFCLWLTLTQRVLDRPLLGVSVAGAVLYVLVFNHPPATIDIVGLWNPNIAALSISALIASILASALALRRP